MTSSTDVSLATTIPNAHTVTGNFSGSGSNNFDFSGSTGTFDTSTGNVTLRGNTSVASGKTLTAGAGTTTGTGTNSGVNVAVTSGLSSGTLLNVDTGTSAFSGNAVNITSGGDFSGTLVKLTADSTTAGTVLGIHTNALTSGAVINADLGSSIYTGAAGALRLTANSASSGTLLAISGTTLALNGGTAAQITLGTPGGTANTDGKALSVLLGTFGDAVYADAAVGYTGSFARYQVAGVDVLNVTRTTITTSQSIVAAAASTGNFDFSASTGTFDTSTGNVTLRGNTTVAAGKNLTAAVGAGNFDFSASTGTFDTSTGNVTLRGNTTLAANKTLVAAAGTGALDFSAASGTFDTSTGAVTLRGNTATASGVTFTGGSGISGATNAVTVGTGLLTTGSAVNVNVGASVGTGGTQGLGIDISGTGAFAGTGNLASLARIASTGAFSGTLAKLTADNTQTGTVLGISAASLTTGKAIDVQLAAAYSGGGTNQGAVNVRGGAFTGNLLSVSAGSDAQTSTASLANFAAPLTQGHVVNIAVTGTYVGTGAVFLDLTGATGVPTGTGILINAASAYTGRFIDLQLAGTSKLNVDPTNINTTDNFVQTGATTFSTGTGNISLNGNIVTNITQTGATTFSTGTGNISLNGNIVTNITQTGATTFSTGTGAVTLNGNTSIVSGKTLTVGGGTAIKAIELGTCSATNGFSTVCSAAAANTTGITLANLLVTDSITISAQTAAVGPCDVDTIVAATSFRINCSSKTGATTVFNVLVVRR